VRDGLFVPPPHPLPPLAGLALHVFGVRGRGMRTVAVAAAAAGADVDGCDRRGTGDNGELDRHGLRARHGHDVSHVAGRRLIATTVTPLEHPELRAAQAAGMAHHRADLLAALVRERPSQSVAITGTHGKGTVAALIGLALVHLDADPWVLLGLTAPQLGGSIRLGSGPAVVEADESDGTIDRIRTGMSVVTNVAYDHPQYRRSVRETRTALAEHVATVPADGRVILGSGGAMAQLAAAARAPFWRLGRDFVARVLETNFGETVIAFRDPGGGSVVGRLRFSSVYLEEDVALAYAALRALGYSPEAAVSGLAETTHLARRCETVGIAGGVRVVDDFGKHPACISATIRMLLLAARRRLHALYEPHRHDHVSRWGHRLATALAGAHRVVLLPVHDEDFKPRRQGPPDWWRRVGLEAELAVDEADAVRRLCRQSEPGDVIGIFGVHDHLANLARKVLATLGDPTQGSGCLDSAS
jgi:UDP-N-acetylmuramate--alanine ligase